jgi:cytochrome c-type biogenesis protein CcmF
MGYVGFSVAFAFAIASLLSGRLDAAWARWSRPWTTAAWVFLTLGIALGSWWAYYELGWGGWWFWDPVENASFIPWLVGTALLHSLAVTEKRGGFKSWTVLLAITAFSLSLLGTFLVRSGVLTSVHAFATDPRRGIFILIFLILVVGSSLTLYAWRAPKSTMGGKFSLSSRETLILLGNVFLVVSAGSVLLGTLYPLLIDALHLGKISVGPPYFNSVFVPIMIPLLVLMGVGPWANWKNTDLVLVIKRLWLAGLLAVVAGIAIPLVMGQLTWLAGNGFLLAFWIIASGCLQIIRQAKAGKPTRSFMGMQLAHLGIAVFVIGITMVGGYQEEKDVRMSAGDTVSVGGYEIQLQSVAEVSGPNYKAMRGTFLLAKNGKTEATLLPEKRSYFSSTMPMTEAAIDVGLTRDIYVSLGEELDDKSWAVRVYYKPFVDWIWGGCLLMALGGVLAISDKRYRIKLRKQIS